MINGIGPIGYGTSNVGSVFGSTLGVEEGSLGTGVNATEEAQGIGKVGEEKANGGECQTCKNRKYQDGSDEMVSFKAATQQVQQCEDTKVSMCLTLTRRPFRRAARLYQLVYRFTPQSAQSVEGLMCQAEQPIPLYQHLLMRTRRTHILRIRMLYPRLIRQD